MDDESGQVVVLAIGLALLVLAAGGLVVDVTRAYLAKRSLQDAADAAALAGAGAVDENAYYGSGGSDLRLDPGGAASVARRWLALHDHGAEAQVTGSERVVVVALRTGVRTSLLRLVGLPTVEVRVVARAAPGQGAIPP